MVQIVAEAWEQTLRVTPDPFDLSRFGPPFGPQLTYREQLDRQPRNAYGELIPRIETVRLNLRRLGTYKA